MKFSFIISSCILSLLIACSDASKESESRAQKPSIKDTIEILRKDYDRVLTAYCKDEFTEPDILLGFKIGMGIEEFKRHAEELEELGKIVIIKGAYYAFIPSNEYEDSDKNQVHQFIADLHIHLNREQTELAAIHVSLYGPRFLIAGRPYTKDDFLKEWSGDEARKEYEERLETPASKIKRFFNDFLETYKAKYGRENHRYTNTGDSSYLWINGGRIIEVTLKNDYKKLASEYLYREMPKSNQDFTNLLYIGTLHYSSIAYDLKFNESMKKIADDSYNSFDSMYQKNKADQNQKEKERINNSGI